MASMSRRERLLAPLRLGASTAHVEATLSGCDALVLETNHDADMIWGGDYPKWLKARITGPFQVGGQTLGNTP